MESYCTQKGNDLILHIKAVPNSSRNEICGLFDNALKVKIKAPAVENKANEELIKYFAKLLKLPKSTITLKTGSTSKIRSLYIENCTIDKIKAVCGNIEL